eukprot:NODE_111_length_3104_cov_31.401747_g104_i0.p1 GENE.NODE_111_length_3104_cov_31.401747_g104_i0~~NODE_111_length_3104_cov_31.401747_g104_i0.p1  ORF type:complete len:998 (+),score=309.42 NODE_111_length_3104_cov_31.401747_g104_i0:59-2995(+)
MKKVNSSTVVAPHVLHSRGPESNPFSMYSTTNSTYQDLKIPLQTVPIKPVAGTGFGRNNPITKMRQIDEEPSHRTQSMSHAAFAPSATLFGERADQEAEEIRAAVALARRQKRAHTGFRSNFCPILPTKHFEQGKEPILLVKQTLGNKDPILRENGYTGPAPMSTTHRVGYPPHKDIDVDCALGTSIDLHQRRVPQNGAASNRPVTTHFYPHDGWNPSTTNRDLFKNPHQPKQELFQQLESTSLYSVPTPEQVPTAVTLKKVGIPIVDRVRQNIFERSGKGGFRGLTRVLKIMDDNGNRQLDRRELQSGLQTYGIDLTPTEMDEVMRFFDEDRSAGVSVTEFCSALRGPMSEQRKDLVRQAYRILDKNRDQSVTMQELSQAYDPRHHPDVLKGEKTVDEVLRDFSTDWDKNGDATVTLAEFCDYYDDLSAGIDSDEYFELMVRNAWHLSGGKGAAQNTTCRRVLVTHTDGRKTIERLKNDLGIGPHDLDAMWANLKEQGILDIQSVEVPNGTTALEPGALQKAAADTRHEHALQASRKRWVPFRNSTLSSPEMLTTDPNPLNTLYPCRLTMLKEQTMKRQDPVEYSVYAHQDPWATTSTATFTPAPLVRGELRQVLSHNHTALRCKGGEPDKDRLLKLLTGAPHKEVRNGGYALNNSPVFENTQPATDEMRNSMYKNTFQNPARLTGSKAHIIELKKGSSGYTHDNIRNVFPLDEAELKARQPAVQLRKVGIPVVDKVRERIFKRGGSGGFRGLTRVLKIMDDNGNRRLDAQEFRNGLQTYGLDFSPADMQAIMQAFDRDGSGFVDVTEFIRLVRGPMPSTRERLVRQAYGLLDTNGDQSVTMGEIAQLYDVSQHPAVVSKKMTPAQALQEFVSGWDVDGNHCVSFEEFLDYYGDISAGIDDDVYFELMMRNAWHISGGSGNACNTSCRRVLVIHTDGSQTVEEITDDLGIGADDVPAMLANLRRHGLTDVREIKLAG